MAGQPVESSMRLAEILMHLQAWQMRPEVYMVQPESRLQSVVAEAIQQGIGLIVVCGGDGTIESTIDSLMGASATLGIIPIGTRNNITHSLGIPTDSYSQVGKLNLIEYAVQEMTGAFPDDPRIQHYRVKSVDVYTIPEMPVMADGVMLGDGPLRVTIRRHSLAVMAGATTC
jgi:diacylglycerol kinase family enzyme